MNNNMVKDKFIPSTQFIDKLPDLCTTLELISVYDTECHSIPQLVYLLAQKLNQTITNMQHNDEALKIQLDDLNVKLEYLLNEGLTTELTKLIEQMYVDGRLQALVEAAMVDIKKRLTTLETDSASIKTDVTNLKADVTTAKSDIIDLETKVDSIFKSRKNIALMPGYDKDNISTVINGIAFQSDTEYYLNEGEVKSLNTIVVTLPARCKLTIKGKVSCTKSFMEASLALKGADLELGTIEGNKSGDCEFGLKITRGAECTIDIDKIYGFNRGLALEPKAYSGDYNNSDWIQYLKINFFHITGEQIAVDIKANFKETWINENTFNGGGLGGPINVYMHKEFDDSASPQSSINNNKFYNLGVQSQAGQCIKIKKFSGEENYFYDLRIQEQPWDKTSLDIEDNGTKNYFQSTYQIAYERLKLGAYSEWNGLIQTKNWDTLTSSFPMVGNGAMGNYTRVGGRPIIGKLPTTVGKYFEASGSYNLYTVSDMVRMGGATGTTVDIYFKDTLYFENNAFYFSNVYDGTVRLFAGAGGKKYALPGKGLYKVILGNDNTWMEVYKLADGDAGTPS